MTKDRRDGLDAFPKEQDSTRKPKDVLTSALDDFADLDGFADEADINPRDAGRQRGIPHASAASRWMRAISLVDAWIPIALILAALYWALFT